MKVEFIKVPVGRYGETTIARQNIAKVDPKRYGSIITLNTLDKDGKQEVVETSEKYETIMGWLNQV